MTHMLSVLVLLTLFNSSIQQANRIRLVGGSKSNEGRLEVRPAGSSDWGTVCHDWFGTNDATVVCRMLGYSGSVLARRSAYYGQVCVVVLGSGNIYMDDLRCTGTETSLFNCPYSGWGNHDCDHSEDTGVLCLPSSDLECRSVRFSGSFSDQYHHMTVFTMTGELEDYRPVYKSSSGDYLYYYSLLWGPGSWHVGPYLGTDTVGMYVDDTSTYPENISGTWYLLDGFNEFKANSHVRVLCVSSEGMTTFGIAVGVFVAMLLFMLIIGLCYCKVCKKKWPVSDSELHNTRSEDNSSPAVPPTPSTPPPAYSPPIQSDPDKETRRSTPQQFTINMARFLFLLVLATLFNTSVQQASRIRLVGGSRPNEGRVEVRRYASSSYSWGTVCHDYFDMVDAGVACRMLGYTGASAYRTSAYYGQGL
ncbi:neurotrypsin-like [Branchiostoma lanceolatum]|uniref:neurotrypsin-like n=1 Tax=Branchiostoma lanceolatum TaxID=7740 RepID=UPI003455DAB1